MSSAFLLRTALLAFATLPTATLAHSLDVCAPRVTIFTPDSHPAGYSPRSFTAQASLFLDRVPEKDLKASVSGVPSGEAVPATYLFSGSDTRWRLKSPLSTSERASGGIARLSEQKHFLVPSDLTKPYGTIVVSGTDFGPGKLINPSMIAHLADGRGIVLEPRDLDADCTLDLKSVEEAFLEGIAYHFDHHH